MPARSFQRNAADPKQIRFAQRKAEEAERRYLESLRAMLQLPAGRIFIATLLARGGLEDAGYDGSGSAMYFREGRREFVLELKRAALDADDRMFQLMEREARAWFRGQQAEVAAMQTPAAEEGDDPNG